MSNNHFESIHLEYMLLPETHGVLLLLNCLLLNYTSAVSSEEETDLIIQGKDTAPSSTYLNDFNHWWGVRLVSKFLFHLK